MNLQQSSATLKASISSSHCGAARKVCLHSLSPGKACPTQTASNRLSQNPSLIKGQSWLFLENGNCSLKLWKLGDRNNSPCYHHAVTSPKCPHAASMPALCYGIPHSPFSLGSHSVARSHQKHTGSHLEAAGAVLVSVLLSAIISPSPQLSQRNNPFASAAYFKWKIYRI